MQGVYREMRIEIELRLVALGPALKVNAGPTPLGGNCGWRSISGRLEDRAQQHWRILYMGAGPLHQLRQSLVGQIAGGTAEIEKELHRPWHAHQASIQGRRSSSWVQASRGCECKAQ